MNIEKLLKQDATLIDVRTPEEYNMGHASGSINIPLGEITMHLEQLRAMQKPLLLVCASGNRSGQATMLLTQCGITEVYNCGAWSDVNNLQSLNAK